MFSRKGKISIAIAAAATVVLTITPHITSLETAIGEDVDAMELRSIIVEGWEKEPWVATAEPGAPIGTIESKIVEGVPENLSFDESNKNSYGIRFHFVYSNFSNKVVLKPPADRVVTYKKDVLNEETQEPMIYSVPGIRLPGKVKAVSVWVLGRGNEYELEGWIEDWKGDTHIYQFGSVDFIGWRPMTINIPNNVPQDVSSFPQTKTLVFKKFVLRATPKTSSEKVVLFFDSLKVLTDMYDVYFDGADIHFDEQDKEEKEEMKKYEKQLKQQAESGGSSNGGTAQ